MKKNQSVFPHGVCRFAVAAALCAMSLCAFAGRAFYISPTSQGTLPTGWNKCPFVISKSQPKMFTGLVDSEGNATDVKLFLMIPATANYANSTRPFTGEAAEFEPMRSVVNNQSVCSTDPKVSELGLAESCIRARFEGLDPAKLYAFTFAAQRINGNTDDLSARYTVNGANSGAIIMNAYNCTNRVARLPGIAPLPDGSIEFSVEAAESNTYWKRFGYLTGLKLEEMDDLGDEDIYIDARTAPVSPSWTWNTVPMQSKGSYRGLLDRNGNQTRIGIDVAAASGSGNNSATLDLTGDAAEFNDARASNNAQVYFNKSSHGRATVLGLYPNCTYSFTFVASRADNDATKIYTTKYTVTGANSGSSTLDARNNATNVARVGGIRPTERGEAVIDIDPGDDCNVSWFYIMAFKITRETRYSSDMRAMTVDATAGGSVSATVAGMTTNTTCYLPADKTLVATATPDAGYRFVGWTSSFTNATVTTNPFTISAAQSATWTAVFEQDSAYVRKTAYIDAHETPANDGKTWNLFDDAKYGWNQMQGPLVASDGSASAVALRTILPFGMRSTDSALPVNNNATASGVTFTGDAAEFEAARRGNRSLYIQISGSGAVGNVTNRGVVAYDVVGLKPGRPYTFRFAAARDGSGAREGLYRAIGQNRVTASLEPMGNSTQVAKVADVLPDENGTIRLEILSGPNNANGARFVYLTAFSIEGDLSDAGGRRILWFGNSFSNGGDIPKRVADLAELAGYARPVIVNASENGQNLAYHIGQVTSNPSANIESDVIMYQSSGNWDDVVIQGYSTEATSAYATPPAEGFIPNATNLYALVRNSAKGDGVRGVLYQTWARATGHEFYPDTFASPDAMQDEIVPNYARVADLIRTEWGNGAVVTAPVGAAFRNAQFSPDFYSDDLYHAGGRYGYELVAMVLFNAIYGEFIEEKTTYAEVLAAGATELSESEWNRLARYAHTVFIHGCTVIFR